MTPSAPKEPSGPKPPTDRSELLRNLALLVFPAYAVIALLLFLWPQTATPPEGPQQAARIAELQAELKKQTAINARQARELEALRAQLRAARATAPAATAAPAKAEAASTTKPAPSATRPPPTPPPQSTPPHSRPPGATPPSPTPAPRSAPTEPAPPQATPAPAQEAAAPRYTVRAGETLGAIAKAECGQARDWRDILAANSAQLDRAEDLRPGMRLRIPCASPSP